MGDNDKSSYKWIVDNSSITSMTWQPGEPSNPNELCGGAETKNGLKLFDIGCYLSMGAVCEADLTNLT